jgi:2-C-methyl-D-erythritol 4-phosphate cytidylyltransferase
MGGDRPKQYLSLGGVPVLQRSLDALLAWGDLRAVVVALSAADTLWPTLPACSDSRVIAAEGGARRSDSVLAGLRRLGDRAAADDWVLVHDAARPCLRRDDLLKLVAALADDPVGGLLAVPVAETVKRADSRDRVVETVSRAGLWLAQTPQLFRYGMLCEALESASRAGVEITDEAAAIERMGHRPRLVPGSPGNIKITRPDDLPLAGQYLAMGET